MKQPAWAEKDAVPASLEHQLMEIRDYDPNEDREQYIYRMERDGYKIITPAPGELFIDIDTQEQWEFFQEQYRRLRLVLPNVRKLDATESKSGYPKRHVIVIMPEPLEPWQRVAYQAALGSDPIREILNCARLQKGDIHPVLFVEKKETEERPVICVKHGDKLLYGPGGSHCPTCESSLSDEDIDI